MERIRTLVVIFYIQSAAKLVETRKSTNSWNLQLRLGQLYTNTSSTPPPHSYWCFLWQPLLNKQVYVSCVKFPVSITNYLKKMKFPLRNISIPISWLKSVFSSLIFYDFLPIFRTIWPAVNYVSLKNNKFFFWEPGSSCHES